MYARSTTIKGDPSAVDAGIAHVRDEVLPKVTTLDGCLGMSFVIDRETGRGIATTAWESEEALNASAERVGSIRSRATEIMNAEAPLVENWEVAAMHRNHTSRDGSCCRITWTHAPDLDTTVDFWRNELLPKFERMDGFCSASMLIDRVGSRTCGTVTFDSRAALEASRAEAATIRDLAARAVGVEFLDVAEFELAMAHLRLPELV
ncbi:antibiotic biosynthesis monooxygenase [Nocardioides koreensis]|uniref:Antibiotic biosynthesis monooxygenase n=1 Tax=Nocardioides koreensis TaxID=433651 RepID=A0ABP5LFU5_9ACTN